MQFGLSVVAMGYSTMTILDDLGFQFEFGFRYWLLFGYWVLALVIEFEMLNDGGGWCDLVVWRGYGWWQRVAKREIGRETKI